MEELLTDRKLKKFRQYRIHHFPACFKFETANLKILTKFVFGKYAKLSNKNIIDLGLAFRNLKWENIELMINIYAW